MNKEKESKNQAKFEALVKKHNFSVTVAMEIMELCNAMYAEGHKEGADEAWDVIYDW